MVCVFIDPSVMFLASPDVNTASPELCVLVSREHRQSPTSGRAAARSGGMAKFLV